MRTGISKTKTKQIQYSKTIRLSKESLIKLEGIIKSAGYSNLTQLIQECIEKDFYITQYAKGNMNQIANLYEILLLYRNNFDALAELIKDANPTLHSRINEFIEKLNKELHQLWSVK